jgi:hypothetical protein
LIGTALGVEVIFGLELMPSREPVEMLVVEKAP